MVHNKYKIFTLQMQFQIRSQCMLIQNKKKIQQQKLAIYDKKIQKLQTLISLTPSVQNSAHSNPIPFDLQETNTIQSKLALLTSKRQSIQAKLVAIQVLEQQMQVYGGFMGYIKFKSRKLDIDAQELISKHLQKLKLQKENLKANQLHFIKHIDEAFILLYDYEKNLTINTNDPKINTFNTHNKIIKNLTEMCQKFYQLIGMKDDEIIQFNLQKEQDLEKIQSKIIERINFIIQWIGSKQIQNMKTLKNMTSNDIQLSHNYQSLTFGQIQSHSTDKKFTKTIKNENFQKQTDKFFFNDSKQKQLTQLLKQIRQKNKELKNIKKIIKNKQSQLYSIQNLKNQAFQTLQAFENKIKFMEQSLIQIKSIIKLKETQNNELIDKFIQNQSKVKTTMLTLEKKQNQLQSLQKRLKSRDSYILEVENALKDILYENQCAKRQKQSIEQKLKQYKEIQDQQQKKIEVIKSKTDDTQFKFDLLNKKYHQKQKELEKLKNLLNTKSNQIQQLRLLKLKLQTQISQIKVQKHNLSVQKQIIDQSFDQLQIHFEALMKDVRQITIVKQTISEKITQIISNHDQVQLQNQQLNEQLAKNYQELQLINKSLCSAKVQLQRVEQQKKLTQKVKSNMDLEITKIKEQKIQMQASLLQLQAQSQHMIEEQFNLIQRIQKLKEVQATCILNGWWIINKNYENNNITKGMFQVNFFKEKGKEIIDKLEKFEDTNKKYEQQKSQNRRLKREIELLRK